MSRTSHPTNQAFDEPMGPPAILAAEAAQVAAIAHPGGAHYGWARLMARNTYTIDPKEPVPDEQDREKDRLIDEAKRLASRFENARNWTIFVGGRVRQWLT